MPNVSQMVNNITQHKPRNEYIGSIVSDILQKQSPRNIIIFSERVQHLYDLKEKISCNSIGFIIGGMSEKDIQEQDGKNVILCTYAMAQEGLDIKNLDTLVIASPKKNIQQCVGRILRKENYNNTPLILDIVDSFGSFKTQAEERRRYYKREKYTIFNSYEDFCKYIE